MRDRNLTSKLTPWIEKAIEANGQGEDILWQITVIPAPDGTIPVVLAIWLPGAILGTAISGAVMISNPFALDDPSVDRMIFQVLEQLRTQRSDQLSLEPKNTVSPLLNGVRP